MYFPCLICYNAALLKIKQNISKKMATVSFSVCVLLVREPAVGLIMWLRPKGWKVYSYVEKYAELKNQSLKKSVGTQSCYAQRDTPG